MGNQGSQYHRTEGTIQLEQYLCTPRKWCIAHIALRQHHIRCKSRRSQCSLHLHSTNTHNSIVPISPGGCSPYRNLDPNPGRHVRNGRFEYWQYLRPYYQSPCCEWKDYPLRNECWQYCLPYYQSRCCGWKDGTFWTWLWCSHLLST